MSPRIQRIVHYYPRALVGKGGVTLSMRGFTKAIAGLGIEVVVLCDSEKEFTEDGVIFEPVRHSGTRRWRRPHAIAEHLRAHDILVVHSGWSFHNICAARDARRLGVRYIVTPHGAYHPKVVSRRRYLKKVWKLAFEGTFLRHAAAVHVSFGAEVENLRSFGYHGAAIVAAHGIDVPDAAAWDGGTGGYVVWLGRLDVAHKGLDLLVEAIASMTAARRPRVKLHGAGSAEETRRVRSLVRESGVEDWVELLPPVYGAQKWDALRSARMFVYPSRWDSHSVAMMEACAAGVPLITTRATFLGQTLAAQGAAIAVELTPDALSRAIESALGPEGQALSVRARDLASTQYSWKAVAAKFIDEAERCLMSA